MKPEMLQASFKIEAIKEKPSMLSAIFQFLACNSSLVSVKKEEKTLSIRIE